MLSIIIKISKDSEYNTDIFRVNSAYLFVLMIFLGGPDVINS